MTTPKSNIDIRKAERQDVPLLLEFIKGIARYEKLENEVIASAEVLEKMELLEPMARPERLSRLTRKERTS